MLLYTDVQLPIGIIYAIVFNIVVKICTKKKLNIIFVFRIVSATYLNNISFLKKSITFDLKTDILILAILSLRIVRKLIFTDREINKFYFVMFHSSFSMIFIFCYFVNN